MIRLGSNTNPMLARAYGWIGRGDTPSTTTARSHLMSTQPSLKGRWDAYRPTKGLLFWSFAVGAIGATIVGFAWGGWVTGGSAQKMVADAASGAQAQLVAAVCVDRFQSGTDAPAQLVALKGMQSWDRTSFIEKGGWALMPDKVKPANAALRLCADQLAAL
jgi:hypothetical protein